MTSSTSTARTQARARIQPPPRGPEQALGEIPLGGSAGPAPLTALPRWPFAALFVPFPLWWALGPGDAMWIPIGVVMLLLLLRRGGVRIPKPFLLWIVFMLLMAASVIGIDSPGRLLGFGYRWSGYMAFTVVFVYVFNARERLTPRYVLGVLSVFWLWTVLGGYASLMAPTFSFNTLLHYVLPRGLLSNELIGEMATRRLTQYKPDGWLKLEPRPSAPFLYTNSWGNVYSMLLPVVLCYVKLAWGTWRARLLLLLVPLSLLPAFLTLNRGMFLGLGVAFLFVGGAAFVKRQRKLLAAVLAVLVLLGGAALQFDVGDRISDRTEASSTTEDRANLYQETFERTLQSPLFGYGAPRPSVTPGAPSAGTQGQIWMIMFSHGFPALFFFLAWLTWSFLVAARTRDPVRIGLASVLLVILVESAYYGVGTNGLILAMSVSALLMRRGAPRGQAPGIRTSLRGE